MQLLHNFFSFLKKEFHNCNNYCKKVSSQKTSQKYNAQRVKGLYDPLSKEFFKLSRSKLESFLRCARCFYLDRRLGVGHPPGYPFSLNIAVDTLLKKEFDKCRAEQMPHLFCIENGLDVIPFKDDLIDSWRDSLHGGIQYEVPNTNLMLYGGVDDIWVDSKTNELIIVDYKETSKIGAISLDSLNDEQRASYKRQVEIYQWLLRKNGFSVSNTAFFVYCNALTCLDSFNKYLKFDISLLAENGDDSWVESAIMNAYYCLQSIEIPQSAEKCSYCQYWNAVTKHINNK